MKRAVVIVKYENTEDLKKLLYAGKNPSKIEEIYEGLDAADIEDLEDYISTYYSMDNEEN